ncbi:MAG: biotin--[acetyl-CoA-carboxylase] ligase [Gemmatimonadaceae bacterium]
MGDTPRVATLYDGTAGDELARRLDVPQVAVFESISSTQDIAHEMAAAGASAGTVVIANSQQAGRGRMGRAWTSDSDRGIWMTLVERPTDHSALQVLSLRVGLRLAAALDRFADHAVQVKWPNDLLVRGQKVAGILIEVRWHADRPAWIAIGVGINVALPSNEPDAGALAPTAKSRIDILEEIVPAVRGAAAARGAFTSGELTSFAARDAARGRMAVAPGRGRVEGIDAEGRLLIVGENGVVHFGSGSLVLEDASS